MTGATTAFALGTPADVDDPAVGMQYRLTEVIFFEGKPHMKGRLRI